MVAGLAVLSSGCEYSNFGSKMRNLGCVYIGGTVDSLPKPRIWASDPTDSYCKYFTKIPAKYYTYSPTWGADSLTDDGNYISTSEIEFKGAVAGEYIWVELPDRYARYLTDESFEFYGSHDFIGCAYYVEPEAIPENCVVMPIIESRIILPDGCVGIPAKGILKEHTSGYPFYFAGSVIITAVVDVPLTIIYNTPLICLRVFAVTIGAHGLMGKLCN